MNPWSEKSTFFFTNNSNNYANLADEVHWGWLFYWDCEKDDDDGDDVDIDIAADDNDDDDGDGVVDDNGSVERIGINVDCKAGDDW